MAKAPLTVEELISKLNDFDEESQVMIQLEDDEDGAEVFASIVDLREEPSEDGPVIVLEFADEDEDEG